MEKALNTRLLDDTKSLAELGVTRLRRALPGVRWLVTEKRSMMKVKMILPALTEAKSPFFRPIKYSLFPPLGLATLAAYLPRETDIHRQDEHVENLDLNDAPDLVVIQAYITSAKRAYALADHYRKRG